MAGELKYNKKLLERAAGTDYYWDPRHRTLVAGEWAQEYRLLADEPRLQDAYRLTESAYQGLDEINHTVEARARAESGGELGPPIGLIKVLPGDGLPSVLAAGDQAMTSLDSVLRES